MGELRITGGEFRGRKIGVPRGVRPTSSRVREALFNLLANRVEGAVVLDLFAGSGVLGLEAMSRGARDAVFVEKAGARIGILRRNIASLGLKGRVRAIKGDWRGVAARLAAGGGRFDLIMADPPYGFWKKGDTGTKLLRLPVDFDIVAASGILVIERPVRAHLPDEVPGIEKIIERAYGDSVLSFYRKGGDS